jgi:hypothetical protein
MRVDRLGSHFRRQHRETRASLRARKLLGFFPDDDERAIRRAPSRQRTPSCVKHPRARDLARGPRRIHREHLHYAPQTTLCKIQRLAASTDASGSERRDAGATLSCQCIVMRPCLAIRSKGSARVGDAFVSEKVSLVFVAQNFVEVGDGTWSRRGRPSSQRQTLSFEAAYHFQPGPRVRKIHTHPGRAISLLRFRIGTLVSRCESRESPTRAAKGRA